MREALSSPRQPRPNPKIVGHFFSCTNRASPPPRPSRARRKAARGCLYYPMTACSHDCLLSCLPVVMSACANDCLPHDPDRQDERPTKAQNCGPELLQQLRPTEAQSPMPLEEQRPSTPEQPAFGGDTMALDDGCVITCELACMHHARVCVCVCVCACACACVVTTFDPCRTKLGIVSSPKP